MNKKNSRVLSIALALTLIAAIAIPTAAASLNAKELTAYTGVKLYVDSTEVHPKDVDGIPVDTFIVDGTTYLPARALSEALGSEISYDGTRNSVYVDSLPYDDKAADYLEEYFGITATTPYNDALRTIFGESATVVENDTVGAAVKATVESCGLKELALVYSAEKTAASTEGVAGVTATYAPYIAAALDASLASGTWNFSVALDSDTAAQLLMNAVNIAGKGRNYLGNVSDTDIAQKVMTAWNSFANFDNETLATLGEQMVLTGASTGYGLKYDGYNANFLSEYTIQYGHSDIVHAVQLISLLNGEGIDAKVQLEPKTSVYEYMVEWGDPTQVPTTPTYALKQVEGTERWLCYAVEYDMKLEFETMEGKNAFEGLIGKYSKKWDSNTKDGQPIVPLLRGAWWQPLFSSSVAMKDTEAYTVLQDNVVRDGGYTVHPFTVVDGGDAIAELAAEAGLDVKVEIRYVNNAFYNYLTGVDHQ